MIIDVAISTAPYLVPFAAGMLVTSVAGLRRARKAVAVAPLRVGPELPEPSPAPPMAVPEPTVEHVSPLPEIRRRMAPRLIVSQARAAEILIEHMNSEDAHGYFTKNEIDEWWGFACAARDIERINGAIVREALAARGLRVGQRRLNTPEFLCVRQRTGQVRPVLYRIPRCRTVAERTPDAPDLKRPATGQAGSTAACQASTVQANSRRAAA